MSAPDPGAEQLLRMLEAAGIAPKPSYNPEEVRRLLGISERTFHRMTREWEPDLKTGAIPPGTLDSYLTRGHRRVRHEELARYLRENRFHERTYRVDPRQLALGEW